MNPEVDAYIRRSEQWPEEMAGLRPILLGCGLTEEIKWRKPCYSHKGGNIAILQEMKQFLALMFFKGALLKDPEGILEDQGPNSRSARRIRFTSVEDVARLAGTVKAYVDEAVDVEEAGLKVGPAPEPLLAAELQSRPGPGPGTEGCVRGPDLRPEAGVQPVLLGRQTGQDPRRTSREVRREDPGRQRLPRQVILRPPHVGRAGAAGRRSEAIAVRVSAAANLRVSIEGGRAVQQSRRLRPRPVTDSGPAPEKPYLLGTDPDEGRRLETQHRLWSPEAHDLWDRAGFGPGDRLLDLGCGPGFAGSRSCPTGRRQRTRARGGRVPRASSKRWSGKPGGAGSRT